jgi:serine/threonine-protein kinase
MRADRAITVLEAAGFQVTVDSIETDLPEGRVFATVPEPGVDRALPARVYLTVSLGPKQFAMIDLVGLEEDRARELLRAVGLEIGEVEERMDFQFSRGPEILEHTPPAGFLVAPGAKVNLVIRRSF